MRQPVPFGKYLLLDRISVGGMAEVFKAKSYGVEGFEKVIAIKRILPSMGEDADFIKMFIDEAKIAGQLSHANICQIFELGKITGAHFIAMEYIWGKDLLQIQNRAKRRKVRVPVLMACYIIAKACEGLHYAHKKRDAMGSPLEIVHRDCSPQNILVSYEGEVKIIDFGIARAASRSSRTQAGVLKGKFGYMSPEQVRGLPLDRRSDIFSLGTVLYETLTGERLFVGESDFSTLERVRNADVARPSDLNPNVPPEVERIVMKALCRDRDKRYQWCAEMQADLQAYLTQQEEVVSNKGLGEAVRSLFMTELEREKDAMERYKKVGRDGLITGVPQAKANLEVNAELGEAGPIEGDPTILGGPDFAAMFPNSPAVAATQLATVDDPIPSGNGRSAAKPAVKIDRAAYTSDFEEKPTAIFDEDDERVGGGPIAALAAQANSNPNSNPNKPGGPTLRGPGAAGAGALSPRSMGPPPPPANRPRSASGQPMTGSGQPMTGSGQHPMAGQRPMTAAPHPQHGPPGHRPMTSSAPPPRNPYGPPVGTNPRNANPQPVVAYPSQNYQRPAQMVAFPPNRRRDRSYAVRDIAIGVGIAAIVLTIFAVVRFVWTDDEGSKGTTASETSGSVEVAIAGAKVAEVLVDDKVAGEVTEAAPLVFTTPIGSRRITVRSEGIKPCEKQVAVTEGQKAEVSCEMKPLDDGGGGASPQAVDAGVRAAADATVDDLVVPAENEQKAEQAKAEKLRLDREKREKDKKAKEAKEEKEAKEKADAANKGFLVANSSPFARVIVDGRNTGKMTPMGMSEKIPLSAGRHSVTFVVGSKKYKYGVTIKAGETKRFYRQLPVKKDDDEEEDDEEE